LQFLQTRHGKAFCRSAFWFLARALQAHGEIMALVSLQNVLFGSIAPPPSKAKWKVWRDSTTQTPKFQPLDKREAWRRYHDAERIERETRQPGHQDGAIGRNGLAVMRALLGLVNFATGALVPAVITIARHACISVRSAFRGLKSLKLAGLLAWTKRAIQRVRDDGSFLLEQDTSAYVILPPTQWRVTVPKAPAKPAPPPPEPETWGAHAPIDEGDDGGEHDPTVTVAPADCGLSAALGKFLALKPKTPVAHETAKSSERLSLQAFIEVESSAKAVPAALNTT
jgi:hypothetical protein